MSVSRTTASGLWNRRSDDGARDLALIAVIGHNAPSAGPSTTAGWARPR